MAALCLLGVASCADVPELPYPTPDPNGGNGGGGTVTGLPFTSASLNDFTVQTIEGIEWSLGSSYAKASGYTNGNTTATQTWLVSPAINTTVSGTEGAYIAFDNVLRYVKSSTDLTGWHKVLVSKDYAGDVTAATWTDLKFQPVESATQTWDFYAATPVVLPDDFLNEEKVYVAFYFQCDGSNSTTWEVKNLTIKEGKPDTGGGTGDDTPADVTSVTIAEFNAADVSTTVWYELVGTASGIKSGDSYGNFDLTDETGTVYVYGLLAEKGGAGKAFQDLVAKTGLANGDKIKIHGQRGDYKGKIEVLNAYFVEIVAKGDGGDGGDTGGDTGDGDGSESSPYNVAYVRSAGNPGTTAWVKGYIVGTVKDGSQTYNDAVFSTTDASNTNILIADAANCTDASLCIPVQLPSGAVRNALSLQQHPENLGQLVSLYGSLEKYFGQPGLKAVSKYTLGGEGGDGGNTGGDDTDALFSADFTASDGGFKAYDVELGSLSYVWQQTSSYGWKGSAYKSGSVAAESYLVSPVIDLTSASAATLSFSHAANYLNGAACTDFLSVCVSTNLDGDVTKASWVTLDVPTWPAGSDWEFVNSGDISLAGYVGNKIVVAFHYTSTDATSPTWEVKSLSVK